MISEVCVKLCDSGRRKNLAGTALSRDCVEPPHKTVLVDTRQRRYILQQKKKKTHNRENLNFAFSISSISGIRFHRGVFSFFWGGGRRGKEKSEELVQRSTTSDFANAT